MHLSRTDVIPECAVLNITFPDVLTAKVSWLLSKRKDTCDPLRVINYASILASIAIQRKLIADKPVTRSSKKIIWAELCFQNTLHQLGAHNERSIL